MLTILNNPTSPVSVYSDSAVWTLATDNPVIALVKVDIKISGVTVATQYGNVINGVTRFNLRGVFMSILRDFNNPLSTPPNPGNFSNSSTDKMSLNLVLDWEEVAEMVITLQESVTIHKNSQSSRGNEWDTGSIWYAYDSQGITPSRPFYTGQVLPFNVIGDNIPHFLYINGNQLYDAPQINRNFQTIVWKENLQDDKLTIMSTLTSGQIGQIVLNLFRVEPCEHSEVLYFLNQWGGWEWSLWTSVETTWKTNKTTYNVYDDITFGSTSIKTLNNDLREEKKLFGIAWAENYWLRGLMSSPIILDSKGRQVEILDNNILTESPQLIQPELTISYKQNNIMTY